MDASTLVIVCGHGVAVNPDALRTDAGWIGIYPGEGPLLLEHIRFGVAIAATCESVLVFSGAATRKATALSEGESYLRVAQHFDWFGNGDGALSDRAFAEIQARDSLQNVVFSLGTFRKHVGRYPEAMICCGFGFKKKRLQRHARDIGWTKRFLYLGVNDPEGGGLATGVRGEKLKLAELDEDPFLQNNDSAGLRAERNPWNLRFDFEGEDDFVAFARFLNEGGRRPALPDWTK